MNYALPGLLLTATIASGCAGKVDYIRPTTMPQPAGNVKLIDKPRDAVWATSVPALGKQYYVINNLDKSSGLINVSYNGNPERYVDCGRIVSYVKNARGERTYSFAGSSSQQVYEVMDVGGSGLTMVDRRMSLDGRINLVFEEVSANQTRVTANTRYVMQKLVTIRAMNGSTGNMNDTISFNSGGSSTFPGPINPPAQGTECVATGALEREILSVIN